MEHHLKLLGWKVKDQVTGFTGIVTHVGLDLQGCVQAIVFPSVVKEKTGAQKLEDSRWFDTSRLTKIGAQAAVKPVPMKGDRVVAGSENYKPVK